MKFALVILGFAVACHTQANVLHHHHHHQLQHHLHQHHQHHQHYLKDIGGTVQTSYFGSVHHPNDCGPDECAGSYSGSNTFHLPAHGSYEQFARKCSLILEGILRFISNPVDYGCVPGSAVNINMQSRIVNHKMQCEPVCEIVASSPPVVVEAEVVPVEVVAQVPEECEPEVVEVQPIVHAIPAHHHHHKSHHHHHHHHHKKEEVLVVETPVREVVPEIVVPAHHHHSKHHHHHHKKEDVLVVETPVREVVPEIVVPVHHHSKHHHHHKSHHHHHHKKEEVLVVETPVREVVPEIVVPTEPSHCSCHSHEEPVMVAVAQEPMLVSVAQEPEIITTRNNEDIRHQIQALHKQLHYLQHHR